jgi:hypothetical protein
MNEVGYYSQFGWYRRRITSCPYILGTGGFLYAGKEMVSMVDGWWRYRHFKEITMKQVLFNQWRDSYE